MPMFRTVVRSLPMVGAFGSSDLGKRNTGLDPHAHTIEPRIIVSKPKHPRWVSAMGQIVIGRKFPPIKFGVNKGGSSSRFLAHLREPVRDRTYVSGCYQSSSCNGELLFPLPRPMGPKTTYSGLIVSRGYASSLLIADPRLYPP